MNFRTWTILAVVGSATTMTTKQTCCSAFTTATTHRSAVRTNHHHHHHGRLFMGFDTQEFTVGILGDLHIDPRKMEDYYIGREQWLPIFDQAKAQHGNVALVSLGDLGESKNCDHNPNNPSELFAGTTICHEMAAEYLNSFGVPYEVVGGNHGTFWCCCYWCMRADLRNPSVPTAVQNLLSMDSLARLVLF
jgi:hypothetical protein